MSTLKTEIIILTKYHRVEGEIDLLPGARLTDFMNGANKFIAITNATVIDRSGKELVRGEFVDVLVRNIEVILPAECAL